MESDGSVRSGEMFLERDSNQTSQTLHSFLRGPLCEDHPAQSSAACQNRWVSAQSSAACQNRCFEEAEELGKYPQFFDLFELMHLDLR